MKVGSKADKESDSLQTIQNCRSRPTQFPNNIPLQKISKQKTLDWLGLTPEETKEVMSFDEQQPPMPMGMPGMPPGRPPGTPPGKPCKRRNVTSGAGRNSRKPSTIGSKYPWQAGRDNPVYHVVGNGQTGQGLEASSSYKAGYSVVLARDDTFCHSSMTTPSTTFRAFSPCRASNRSTTSK